VILLLDEVVGHMRERLELPDFSTISCVDRTGTDVPPEWYKPYGDSISDVPPMANFGSATAITSPGCSTMRWATRPSAWMRSTRGSSACTARLTATCNDILLHEEDGIDGANTVVIAYGATARSARHAVKLARQHRHKVGLVTLLTIWPFAEEIVYRAAHARPPGGRA
jgi:2-oxoglutarate/2-oxoacid ferredoxin oxidoreductase subunit alpha